MPIHIEGLDKLINMVSYSIEQNAHNAARLDAIMYATSELLAKQNYTESADEYAQLVAHAKKSSETFLANALGELGGIPE